MLYVSEDLLHGTWNYTSLWVTLQVLETLHSKSFARASLTIGEYRRIVTFQYRLDGGSSRRFIDETLCALRAIHVIKSEGMIGSY
jgi:hypothetical protein